MIMNILLICTGNLCRSPMAEGLMRQRLPAHALFSAGIAAAGGAAADPIAVDLMRQIGIDIGSHRARPLASWMMCEADLVLTMDIRQWRLVRQRYPSAADKVERLGEADGIDIPDPYQRGPDAFRQSLQLIRQAVDCRLPALTAQAAQAAQAA
jgi:protein-tyrosine phosphatase